MATLSLRMRDDLKRKVQSLAEHQGVSLNNFINSIVAASVAQEETRQFFRGHLRDIDLAALEKRVLKFMQQSRRGSDPTPDELQQLIGNEGRLR